MRIQAIAFALLLTGCLGPVERAVQPPLFDNSPVAPSIGGGTDIGSAGDNLPDEHLAAWFVGERGPIRVCVEVDPGFGVSEDVAVLAVEQAFATWRSYIESHRIHADKPATKRLATGIQMENRCHEQTDIAFYLGAEKAEVVKARANGAFKNPTAFVQRTAFDRATAAGRGFIWVSKAGAIRASPRFPDWKREGRLNAVLIHELGHVYGNGHVPGTIMSANISELLASPWSADELARVDHCRELAPCRNCEYLTGSSLQWLPADVVGFFNRAANVDSDRYYHARLLRDSAGRFTGLEMMTGVPTYKFALDQKSTKAASSSSEPVFKVLQDSEVVTLVDESSVQYAGLLELELIPARRGIIAVEYNLATCEANHSDGRSSVQVSVVDGDKQLPFASFPASFPLVLTGQDLLDAGTDETIVGAGVAGR